MKEPALKSDTHLPEEEEASIWRPEVLNEPTWEYVETDSGEVVKSLVYQDVTKSEWQLVIRTQDGSNDESFANTRLECWIEPIDDPNTVLAQIEALKLEAAALGQTEAQPAYVASPGLATLEAEARLAVLGQRPALTRDGEPTPLKAYRMHFMVDPPLAPGSSHTWHFALKGDSTLNCTCSSQGGEVQMYASSPPATAAVANTVNGSAAINRAGSTTWTLTVTHISGAPTYSLVGDYNVVG